MTKIAGSGSIPKCHKTATLHKTICISSSVSRVSALTNPNARHLVHEDEAPLEAVVHLVIARVSDASALDLLPPHLGPTKTIINR
jgi:hypothetical protein